MWANIFELALLLSGGGICLAGSIKNSMNKLMLGSCLCLVGMAFLTVSN
jgi:hypothetical protein